MHQRNECLFTTRMNVHFDRYTHAADQLLKARQILFKTINEQNHKKGKKQISLDLFKYWKML